jgi:hypothetical protein
VADAEFLLPPSPSLEIFFLIRVYLKYVIIRNSIVNSPFPHGIEISTNVQSAKVRPRITGFVGEFVEGYHANVDLTHEVHA